MSDRERLAEQFEAARPRLRSIAYSMLGSLSEAEDAVQETWLRLDRSDTDAIDNPRTWLTTVTGRICLDMLRARKARRTDYVGTWLPEPLVEDPPENRPEGQAETADMIGLALLVVLESLNPPERLAFVLHDVFALPFDEIARLMGRTPTSVRQLASRARRRVQDAPEPERDVAKQRRVVDAFLAAARQADFDALVGVLAPDVVLRIDFGPTGPPAVAPMVGSDAVARFLHSNAPRFSALAVPVLVNGTAGALFGDRDRPISVLNVTVVAGRIAALDLIVDPDKLHHPRTEPPGASDALADVRSS